MGNISTVFTSLHFAFFFLFSLNEGAWFRIFRVFYSSILQTNSNVFHLNLSH